MDFRPRTSLLAQIIAAGGPSRIPARVTWPMHVALRELGEEAARWGLLRQLPADLEFQPAPEAGLRAVGADEALRALQRAGLLHSVGEGPGAAFHVDGDELVRFRRELMALDPEVVCLLQRAGSRWAALVSTLAKYESTPVRSSDASATSGTTCLQLADGVR